MYIGDCDTPIHLFFEILDNSIDESSVVNDCKVLVKIDTKKNSYFIQDNARGIPIGTKKDKLGKDRNDEIFLETADLKIRDINSDYFSYERIGPKDKMFVITNRSGKEGRILIPPEYNDEKTKIYTLNKSTKDIITPYGAIAIKKAC